MDINFEIENIDKEKEDNSGIESGFGGSKDETPERKMGEADESLSERLWGLTEMFPECVRKASATISDAAVCGTVQIYKFSCNASWIFFTSSMILFAPIIFETERAQMEEMQRSQQKQVLLGPGPTSNMPPMMR
ncbi:unnamed protein product [Diamesa hyperborea]